MPSQDQRKKFKARVLVWTDLTLDNVEDIQKSNTPADMQCLLADILHLNEWKEDLRQGILVDLYFYTLQFAKDNGFTSEQMSAWFSIIKSVHEMAVDTPYGNVEPVFEFFKELLLCHSVKRPPYSIALFSVDQVKRLTTYTVNTYFRHFKMYKYAFTPKVRLDLSFEYVGLPVTPEPPQVGDDEEEDEEELGQAEEETDKTEETAAVAEDEDTPAVKELRAIINSALSEQVQQLKTSVDQQIKAKDEEIAKKMGISGDVPLPSKSPKQKIKKGK
ncbi:cilia- and flagella-associated protein 119-like isoform X1 [Montipora capricornis]|uniref:cilia- and flagella-associated protein 119-like isoform X1 n=1 Tax=Montipora capricornis TaxID=246305 RepID=UPI0035F1E43E